MDPPPTSGWPGRQQPAVPGGVVSDVAADPGARPLSRRHFLGAAAWALGGALCGGARAATRLGTHGMVLFGGREALYGYHLAMFHAPHDRQVLLRLGAVDPALDAQLRQALAGQPALWTLNPERFDLDRLSPGAVEPLRGFSADVVLGHFERGGHTVHAAAALRVEQVVAFRPLAPTAGPPRSLRYDVIGAGTERFLVKRIGHRPDFDHIVSLHTVSRPGGRTLTLAADALRSPSLAMLADALRDQAGLVATNLATLYDDRADLQ